MIYAVTWRDVSNTDILAKAILSAKETDRFVFIITSENKYNFDEFISYNKLKIFYQMPQPITNIVHPAQGRRLNLIVLSGGTNETT